MKLALDHHYSPRIARTLRQQGHDVIAVAEMGWEAEDDESLLSLCAEAGRALLTNNVTDFAVIARRWISDGRAHRGLVFTSDVSLPRHRDTIGRYVVAISELIHGNPDDDSFIDRIHWL